MDTKRGPFNDARQMIYEAEVKAEQVSGYRQGKELAAMIALTARRPTMEAVRK